MTVHNLFAGGIVSKEQQEFFVFADDVIVRTIDDMKASGIPQGLIVALLHGHATSQTIEMMTTEI